MADAPAPTPAAGDGTDHPAADAASGPGRRRSRLGLVVLALVVIGAVVAAAVFFLNRDVIDAAAVEEHLLAITEDCSDLDIAPVAAYQPELSTPDSVRGRHWLGATDIAPDVMGANVAYWEWATEAFDPVEGAECAWRAPDASFGFRVASLTTADDAQQYLSVLVMLGQEHSNESYTEYGDAGTAIVWLPQDSGSTGTEFYYTVAVAVDHLMIDVTMRIRAEDADAPPTDVATTMLTEHVPAFLNRYK
jgi:hypothetical protein